MEVLMRAVCLRHLDAHTCTHTKHNNRMAQSACVTLWHGILLLLLAETVQMEILKIAQQTAKYPL